MLACTGLCLLYSRYCPSSEHSSAKLIRTCHLFSSSQQQIVSRQHKKRGSWALILAPLSAFLASLVYLGLLARPLFPWLLAARPQDSAKNSQEIPLLALPVSLLAGPRDKTSSKTRTHGKRVLASRATLIHLDLGAKCASSICLSNIHQVLTSISVNDKNSIHGLVISVFLRTPINGNSTPGSPESYTCTDTQAPDTPGVVRTTVSRGPDAARAHIADRTSGSGLPS
jgi:hypothetical protein